MENMSNMDVAEQGQGKSKWGAAPGTWADTRSAGMCGVTLHFNALSQKRQEADTTAPFKGRRPGITWITWPIVMEKFCHVSVWYNEGFEFFVRKININHDININKNMFVFKLLLYLNYNDISVESLLRNTSVWDTLCLQDLGCVKYQ